MTDSKVGKRAPSVSLLLLFLVGALNLFDRQIINVMAQDIKLALALTDAKLGLLTGTAFGLFYAFLGIPLGRLADRVDRTRLIAAMLVVWSAFTIACGFSSNFVSLFVSRMGVGVGEAGSQPASTALVTDLFPEGRRASAMGIFLVSAPFGSFLGLFLGGLVAQHWGWRAAFFLAGTPGLILVIAIWFMLRDPRAGTRSSMNALEGSLATALKDLMRRPTMGWLATAMVASTFLVYASSAWLPAFFIRSHGFSTGQAGLFTSIAVGLGGGIGTLGAGFLCDILNRRWRSSESLLLLGMLLLSIPSILLTVLHPSTTVALSALFLFSLCAYGWLSPTIRLIQIASGPAHYALAVAICSSFSTVASLAVGMPLVGALSDALVGSQHSAALGLSLAITVPLAALLGVVAHSRVLMQRRCGFLD